MTTLHDMLAAINWNTDDLDAGELISDAVLVARLTRMEDGRSTVLMATTEGIDTVTQVGLIECAKQITEGGWMDTEDDE